jgi:hypothetical protein
MLGKLPILEGLPCPCRRRPTTYFCMHEKACYRKFSPMLHRRMFIY